MTYRLERVSSTLKQCLADILLNEIDNPQLKTIAILDVVVTPDMKRANIYVSSPLMEERDLLKKLSAARGFIKKTLGKKMYLKYIPELYFINNKGYGKKDGDEKKDR